MILIFWELVLATSWMISIRWITHERVEMGSACIAQGKTLF